MAQTIDFTEIDNLNARILFNYPVGENEFVQARLQINCISYPEDKSTRRKVSAGQNFGTPRKTEYTPAELYTFLVNALGKPVATVFRNLYLEAIGEDPRK